MKKQVFKTVIPYIALLIVLLLWNKSCSDKDSMIKLYESTQDSLKKTTDKFGHHVAEIAMLESTNKQMFLNMVTRDSTIKKLQSLVKNGKNVLSATILGSSTGNSVSGSSSIKGRDTVRVNDTIYIYPEYSLKRKNRWEDISIISNKDSVNLKYKIFNESDLTQELIPQKGLRNIFKNPIPTAKVVNLNPHTETIEFRTFTIKCECNKTGFFLSGVGVGAIGTLGTMFLLKR